MKTGFNNLTEEELEEAKDALNPFSFEKYCGVCMFFDTEECPYRDKVFESSYKCFKFYD